MARGVRKTPLEKLREELKKTQEIIEQHKAEMEIHEERAKQLSEEIKLEEFKEVSTILEEKNLSISELKDMLINN